MASVSADMARDHTVCTGSARVVGEREATAWVAGRPDWSVQDGRLRRRLRFESFASAMGFATMVGVRAERENHHPIICIDKRQVEVTLWTRQMSCLTELDIRLAEAIDELVPRAR